MAKNRVRINLKAFDNKTNVPTKVASVPNQIQKPVIETEPEVTASADAVKKKIINAVEIAKSLIKTNHHSLLLKKQKQNLLNFMKRL